MEIKFKYIVEISCFSQSFLNFTFRPVLFDFCLQNFREKNRIDNIKQNDCVLVLLNGVPDYQLNGEECINGITKDGIIFNSETCGIKFSHSNWQEKQIIKIMGQTDLVVNVADRIVLLRLYNSDEVEPRTLYWKNIHLPDIKVKYCFSCSSPTTLF